MYNTIVFNKWACHMCHIFLTTVSSEPWTVKSSTSTNTPLPYLAATGARTTSKSSDWSAEDIKQDVCSDGWTPPSPCLCRDMIATGCEDKNVRVYYLATSSEQPLKVFTGHLAKVFHVRWSPLREGILCSGSDDG